jgi:hypothetical protein
MLMNTGSTSVFWNLPSLEDRIAVAVTSDSNKREATLKWLKEKPAAYRGSVATLRR